MRFSEFAAWLAVVAVLSALLLSCRGEEPIGDVLTGFRGQVVDSISGAVIAEAAIVVYDTTLLADAFRSDSAGQFNAAELGYGNFRLFCLKEGYSTKYKDVTSDRQHSVIDSILFELVPIGN